MINHNFSIVNNFEISRYISNSLFAKIVILLRHFQVKIISRDDGVCCQSNAARIAAARNEYQG